MEDYMAELATIDRLMNERAWLDIIIESLKKGNTEEALRLLERRRSDIDESLKTK